MSDSKKRDSTTAEGCAGCIIIIVGLAICGAVSETVSDFLSGVLRWIEGAVSWVGNAISWTANAAGNVASSAESLVQIALYIAA